jgi:secreted trypsin-like serine protease
MWPARNLFGGPNSENADNYGGIMNFKNIIQSAVVVSLLVGAQAFADGGDQDFVVGGTTVQAGDPIASSTVLIVGESEIINPKTGKPTIDPKTKQPALGTYICSGSIISQDMVVSAAHCVAEDISYPTDPSKIVVIFATTLPMSGPKQIDSSSPSIHKISGYKYDPQWTGTQTSLNGPDAHDLSVIKFEGGLPAGYKPATLLDSRTQLVQGEKVTIAGYGITSSKDQTGASAGTLRTVQLVLGGAYGKTEEQVKDTRTKGSCNGDSGGPAFVTVNGQLYLWGATSRGAQSCATETIYTDIRNFSDFISSSEQALGN